MRSRKSVESVHIVGHADSTGAPRYNQNLSERRAKAVKPLLVKSGVDAKVIKTPAWASARRSPTT